MKEDLNYSAKYIDISMDLNENTLVWIEDEPPQLKPVARQPDHPVNFTWLSFGAHAGTHVDAPYYLFKEKWTVDQIPLHRLVGTCQVIDVTDVEDTITKEDLEKYPITCAKVLLKTKNSYDPLEKFNPNLIALSPEGANYLVDQGVTTLGYDYQTFEREGSNEVHHIFLSKNITLIDNLRLKQAEAKEYFLICLPIKVTGIDAAPARAILVEEK